ncbi:vWA domain-containing protein [Paenibacillus donghaensis]|uniref:Peptidase n=1 Tax=Paenibacillus donghaensis TaxID=414771 RepID=A0A2Z2KI65_9BACL|nr:VWA-like domain-containing protein [Paenibacillus donghaensis]ASA25597.1 peptidase [Paenibacillus donghaensis]
MAKKRAPQQDIAALNYTEAHRFITLHPMFAPLASHAYIYRDESSWRGYPEEGWAVVNSRGAIYVHPKRRGEVEEWIYVLAHCLLYLGFGHFQDREHPVLWNIACDVYISKFLYDMKLGKPPGEFGFRVDIPAGSEQKLYERLVERGVPDELKVHGTAGDKHGDMMIVPTRSGYAGTRKTDWEGAFATGLAMAAAKAVNVAAGYEASMFTAEVRNTPAARARNWFIDHYPLLGALASGFTLIEDTALCQRMDISIAAIDVTEREIYLNPAAGLDAEECKFVLAHELLHAGLHHQERCQGRDHYLWNVACDYVINHWLAEMHVGEIPQVGILLDEEMRGMSAEAIYDRLVTDMRLYRKLNTLRGTGGADMLDQGRAGLWDPRDGVSMDEFCRNALQQGLLYHQESGRGLIPAGLIEEIRALGQPAIQWDVELAKWFDSYFSPVEKVRTYARVSRRQSSTPDIARPKWVDQGGDEDGRTFGVILDTSGSMDRKLLAKALGAIASYSLSRDVPAARVVFCDAAAYDQGYMKPEDIAESVKVRGRGGTVLQPGIDLLQQAEDFPKNGPILIITDGYCDKVYVKREHAYILPKGRHLPFVPKGPVFRME